MQFSNVWMEADSHPLHGLIHDLFCYDGTAAKINFSGY
jgi:hypothetical protein